MTDDQAHTAANLVIGLGLVGAACLVLASPALRRTAAHLARMAARASGPWLVGEARHAWIESGSRALAPDSAGQQPAI